MTAPDPRVGEIEARLAAASKGPWQAGVAATSDGSEVCTTYEQKKAFLALSLNEGDRPLWIVDNGEVIPAATGDGPNAGQNAEFIANAPADVAYLLAELRKAHEALERVEELTTQLLNESKGNRSTANELRKGELTYQNREDIRAHEQASVIGRNHASRIRAAVAAAKGREHD